MRAALAIAIAIPGLAAVLIAGEIDVPDGTSFGETIAYIGAATAPYLICMAIAVVGLVLHEVLNNILETLRYRSQLRPEGGWERQP